MKIAFPTKDQKNIFAHFGRTPGFLIVKIENDNVTQKKFIVNEFTDHAKGHHHEHVKNHKHQHGHGHHHSHTNILNALQDCEVIIANGMGRRLLDDFQNHNKKVFVTQETIIDNAIEKYLSNTIDHNSKTCCHH